MIWITLFDWITAAIIFVCVFEGFKRGFINSIKSFLSFVVSFTGAKILASRLCGPVGDLFFKKTALRILSDKSEFFLKIGQKYETLEEAFGGFSFSLERIFDFKINRLSDFDFLPDGTVSDFAAAIAYIAIFFLTFILLGILLNFVFSFVSRIFKLPPLNFFNKLGGIFAGVLNAFIMCVIFCFGVWVFIIFSSDVNSIAFLKEQISRSILFAPIYQYLFAFFI